MKQPSLLVFVSVMILVYLAGNYYIFIRGWQAIPPVSWLRVTYIVLYSLLALSFLAGRGLEQSSFHGLTKIVTWVGAFWWAILLYLFIAVILIDFSRLLNHWFHIYPGIISGNYTIAKQIVFLSILIIVAVITIAGYYNASHPRNKYLTIDVHKNAGSRSHLKIAMVSDVHLGLLVGEHKLTRMVNDMNSFNPDIVLFVGDILDEMHHPIFRDDIGKPLRRIQAPLGVYAIPGNHEYIGGVGKALQYIGSLNIKMLRDTAVLIDNSFWLIGRDDLQAERFAGRKRAPLEDLIKNVNPSQLLILMDHQPYHLEAAEQNGIDLQVSGHTHHGQFWPLSIITKAIFEVSWGYKKKGNTSVYVSSGYGTWGPPVRVGNQPELVLITINFKD